MWRAESGFRFFRVLGFSVSDGLRFLGPRDPYTEQTD